MYHPRVQQPTKVKLHAKVLLLPYPLNRQSYVGIGAPPGALRAVCMVHAASQVDGPPPGDGQSRR